MRWGPGFATAAFRSPVFREEGATGKAGLPVLSIRRTTSMRDGDQHLMPAATGLPVAMAEHGPSSRSVDDEARQRRALRLLSDVVKAIHAHRDESTMFGDVCRLAASFDDCPVALIALREPSGTLRLRTTAGLAWDADTTADLAGSGRLASVASMAIDSGKPAWHTHVAPAEVADAWDASLAPIGALLALPLHRDHVVDGVFVIGAHQADALAGVGMSVFSEIAEELGRALPSSGSPPARLPHRSDCPSVRRMSGRCCPASTPACW